MNTAAFIGVIRHLLSTVGGYFVGKGSINAEQNEILAGAIAAVIAVVLSIIEKRQRGPGTPSAPPPSGGAGFAAAIALGGLLILGGMGCQTQGTGPGGTVTPCDRYAATWQAYQLSLLVREPSADERKAAEIARAFLTMNCPGHGFASMRTRGTEETLVVPPPKRQPKSLTVRDSGGRAWRYVLEIPYSSQVVQTAEAPVIVSVGPLYRLVVPRGDANAAELSQRSLFMPDLAYLYGGGTRPQFMHPVQR